MRLDKIILELKNIKENEDLLGLVGLIDKLEKELKENNYCKKASDKTKLSYIKKIILAKHNNERPVLQSFTPLKNGQVAFTDDYTLFVLNDSTLPFNVAFQNDWSKEEQDEYLKNKDLNVIPNVFPNINHLIPDISNKVKDFTLNVSNIDTLYKTTPKDNYDKKVHEFSDDDTSFIIDLTYLEYAIKILQLENDFKLEYYGKNNPLIIRNNNEIGLILPIVKY